MLPDGNKLPEGNRPPDVNIPSEGNTPPEGNRSPEGNRPPKSIHPQRNTVFGMLVSIAAKYNSLAGQNYTICLLFIYKRFQEQNSLFTNCQGLFL